jgi:radical SAM protein with 4Fe4S-binding SPASM domain
MGRNQMNNAAFIKNYIDQFCDKDQTKAFKEGRADSCELDLTGVCNAGCTYCYAQSKYNTKDEIPTDILYQVLDDLKEIGVTCVLWEGGEPLLRKDWRDILTYSQDLGFHNRVLTSGFQLSDIEFAKEVLDLSGSIQLHLDTIDEKQFMSVRKTSSDFYYKVIKSIHNIIDLGEIEKLSLCVKILKQNVSSIIKTIDWAVDELGLPGGAILIGPYTPFPGQNKGDTEKYSPTKDEIRDIIGYYYKKVGFINEEDKENGNFPLLCNGNRIWCATNFIINYKGDVKSCTFFPNNFGNVNNERLIDIYTNNRRTLLKHDLHENVKGECHKCFYDEICKGCRANAIGFLDDRFEEDPLCWVKND